MSAGVCTNKKHSQDSLLSLLARGLGFDLDSVISTREKPERESVCQRDGVTIHVIHEPKQAGHKRKREESWQKVWKTTSAMDNPQDQWGLINKRAGGAQLVGSPTSRQGLDQTPYSEKGNTVINISGDHFNPGEKSQNRSTPRVSQLIGILAHRVLEEWDYAEDVQELLTKVFQVWRQGVVQEMKEEAQQICQELTAMFQVFGQSPVYEKLRQATILGKEVPFVVPWKGNGNVIGQECLQPLVMEGVIDLVYRFNDEVWIADFKTDHIKDHSLQCYAEKFKSQMQIYRQAIAQTLGLPSVRSAVIFLRRGEAVELSSE